MMTNLDADQTFTFRGSAVRFARLGQGPALVCLHNGGTSSTIWRHVAAAFADRREVFALDLPGYGASIDPPAGRPLAEHVEMVASFLNERSLTGVDLVGNCLGSAIAILVAARHPQLVRRLVLFNPLSEATFRAGRLASLETLDRHWPAALAVTDAATRRFALPALVVRALLRTQLGDAGQKARLTGDRGLMACYARPNQTTALRHLLSDMGSFRAIDQFTPEPGFPPSCTIWGLQNAILSASAGRRLNETLRPSREVWLDDCGHLPMLERPEVCVEVMTEFLREEPLICTEDRARSFGRP